MTGFNGAKSRWRRLDNTAKIFPVIANENLSQVFRISVTLKETVDPDLLQRALEEILPHIRNFRVKLRRGVFWYYFEENGKVPQVQRENTYPCRYIDPHGNRKFLFRVTYYQRRVNLEVFHALTDGLGALNFLKSLTCHYLRLKRGETAGPEGAGLFSGATEDEEKPFPVEDSYLENYREMPHHSYSSKPAYRMEGAYLPLGSGQVLHGYVKVTKLKEACRKYGVSITKYLAAALIWSVWQEYLEGGACERPVVLNLPINLRAIFGSDTMANFFAVTMIGYLFRSPDVEFADLLAKVGRQMDRKIDRDRLEESISYNVSNEKKWYLRAVPLVIKRPVTSLIFRLKDRAYTMTLSNIGPVSLEPEYADQVERFHLMIGVSRRQPVKCAVCSFGDEMVVTFTSVFADSRLQRRFFKTLREDGVGARLEGNELCAARKRDMYPRVRKIVILRKGGEAKATRMAKQVGHTGETAARGLWDFASGKKSWREELNRRFHI